MAPPSSIGFVEKFNWLESDYAPDKTRAAESQRNGARVPADPRLLVYHAGIPRIMFLGALKITTAFLLGFYSVATIPALVQAGAPAWQIGGLAVASVVPSLLVWYLTHPMVMWMHIRVPKDVHSSVLKDVAGRTIELERFVSNNAASIEVAITTMAPLANARISTFPLAQLRPVKQRFGLVNHVRNVEQENAKRKWYEFRAAGEFKIEDGVINKATQKPWLWYKVQEAVTRSRLSGSKSVETRMRALPGLERNQRKDVEKPSSGVPGTTMTEQRSGPFGAPRLPAAPRGQASTRKRWD